MSHVPFVECTAPACRLRFPLLPPAEMISCPRCGGELVTAVSVPIRATEIPLPEPTEGSHTHNPLPEPVEGSHNRQPELAALLDNIRSIYNVGSMFRTADGVGLSDLHLAGITTTPEHPKVAKTALGAEQAVPWRYHPNGPTAVAALQADGYQVVALEMTEHSRPLTAVTLDPGRPLVLVVGNEICGVDPAILEKADWVAHLPMLGRKRSLNVTVAFGIAVYWLRSQFALQLC